MIKIMQGTQNIRKWIRLGIVAVLLTAADFLLPRSSFPTDGANSLKIALLPILDSLPYYAADANGYFDEYGIQVTAVPVASGLERDQLMQAGAIDAMLNEMTTTANFNRDKARVKIVMSARKADRSHPLFRILSAPGSGLRSPKNLTGAVIGISMNTIIEYVTDRLLAAEGLNPTEIIKKSVPVIPERYQLLLQGRIAAATLPDPLARSALEAGAGHVVDDSSHPQYSVSVLTFSTITLEAKPGVVRLFLKAWDRAVAKINTNPELFRALLLEKIRVPQNIQKIYQIPRFPRRHVPSAEQWDDIMDWMVTKGLLDSPLLYQPSITTDYLP